MLSFNCSKLDLFLAKKVGFELGLSWIMKIFQMTLKHFELNLSWNPTQDQNSSKVLLLFNAKF